MNRAFEIRLYPTKEQQRLLDMTFGACRFVYNNVLSIRQSYFKDYDFKDKDLNIMDMLKAFSSFCNMINYKSKWYGRTYIKIGSFYPSSKLCHCCGYKNTTLTLADREWECPNCHSIFR